MKQSQEYKIIFDMVNCIKAIAPELAILMDTEPHNHCEDVEAETRIQKSCDKGLAMGCKYLNSKNVNDKLIGSGGDSL